LTGFQLERAFEEFENILGASDISPIGNPTITSSNRNGVTTTTTTYSDPTLIAGEGYGAGGATLSLDGRLRIVQAGNKTTTTVSFEKLVSRTSHGVLTITGSFSQINEESDTEFRNWGNADLKTFSYESFGLPIKMSLTGSFKRDWDYQKGTSSESGILTKIEMSSANDKVILISKGIQIDSEVPTGTFSGIQGEVGGKKFSISKGNWSSTDLVTSPNLQGQTDVREWLKSVDHDLDLGLGFTQTIKYSYDIDHPLYDLYQVGRSIYVAERDQLPGDDISGGFRVVTSNGKDWGPKRGSSVVGLQIIEGQVAELYTKESNEKMSFTPFSLSNGNLLAGKAVSLTGQQFFAREQSYMLDLDGNGVIGDTVDRVLHIPENENMLELYLTKSGMTVIGKGLDLGSAVIDSDYPAVTLMTGLGSKAKAWALPKGTQATAILEGWGTTAFDILYKDARGNFLDQRFLEGGSVDGKASKLSNAELVALEKSSGLDLTADVQGAVVNTKLQNFTWSSEDGESVYSLYLSKANWATANKNALALGGKLAVLDSADELYEVYDRVKEAFGSSIPQSDLRNSSIAVDVAKKSNPIFSTIEGLQSADQLSFLWIGASFQGAGPNASWQWVDGQDLREGLPYYGGAPIEKARYSMSLGLGGWNGDHHYGLIDNPMVELVGTSQFFYIVEF
jgi:hypothetical protein